MGVFAAGLMPLESRADTRADTALPIPRSVWLYEVDASALPEAQFRLDQVLDQVVPATSRRLTDSEVRIHIIPQHQNVTDLPPWAELRSRRLPDANPSDGYQEARTYDEVRGLGPATCGPGPLDIAIGEELMVRLPPTQHPSPDGDQLGWSLVHEIGHAVACGLTSVQDTLLAESYAAARLRPASDIVGSYPAYTVSDHREYFAEGTVAWFEAGPDVTYQRSWLAEHDPALHRLMSQIFAVPAEVPSCDGRRATAVVTPGEGPFLGTPGPDVIVGSAGDDLINGAGDSDIVCGGEGDDTLLGSYGADRLFGGPGDDHYQGGIGNDSLDESPSGANGADTMDGGPGDDRLIGGIGDDTLVDTAGRDELVGGAGDDTLDSRDAGLSSPDLVDGSQPVDICHVDADDQVIGCQPAAPVIRLSG